MIHITRYQDKNTFIMKSLVIILTISLLTLTIYAQGLGFGLKGGVNYNFSGDLTQVNDLKIVADDVIHGAENKIGYHAGVWSKFQPNNFLIRTEIIYTQYETAYDNNTALTVQKLNVPIHVGTKLVGPLYIFAGPDFMYTLDESFSVEHSNIKYNDFTVGVNIGLGVEFGRFGLEVKWDKAVTGEETYISNDNIVSRNFETDSRPNQLIFSVLIGF